MTRVKYNYNPKFTREQLLPILYQQTVQVGVLLQQLEDAYMLLEQANAKINQLEEVRKVGGYREVDSNREVEENASEEEEVDRGEEDVEILMEFTHTLEAFADMTQAVRRKMCEKMVFAVVDKAGTVVMNDGEELDSWSVIINGAVRVEGPSR